MDQASPAAGPPKGDISVTERSAWFDGRGLLALGFALAAEPAVLEQVCGLAALPEGQEREEAAERCALRYIPGKRGADARELVALALEQGAHAHAAAVVAVAAFGVSMSVAAAIEPEAARHALRATGSFGFWPSAPAPPGAPRRAAKCGSAHNLDETVAVGARLIVRRGVGLCLNLVCPHRAVAGGYCRRCGSDDSVTRDHNRRLHAIQSVFGGVLGADRARREKRSGGACDRP